DGFAVRAADLPGTLRVVGEIAAGASLGRAVGPGEAAEIMTGAPLPDGADAVVMVEHVTRAHDSVVVGRTLAPGENVVPAGAPRRPRRRRGRAPPGAPPGRGCGPGSAAPGFRWGGARASPSPRRGRSWSTSRRRGARARSARPTARRWRPRSRAPAACRSAC